MERKTVKTGSDIQNKAGGCSKVSAFQKALFFFLLAAVAACLLVGKRWESVVCKFILSGQEANTGDRKLKRTQMQSYQDSSLMQCPPFVRLRVKPDVSHDAPVSHLHLPLRRLLKAPCPGLCRLSLATCFRPADSHLLRSQSSFLLCLG